MNRRWKGYNRRLAAEAGRKDRARRQRSAVERDAQARTAPVFRAIALAGPFVVLALPVLALALLMPSLPSLVGFTWVGRGGMAEDLWPVILVPFGVLLAAMLLLAAFLGRSLPGTLRSEDGAAWATAASLSVGLPAMGALAFVCDLLGQVGGPTAPGAAPWFWVGLAGGLLVGVGIERWQKRWVRRLVADDPRTGV